MVRSALLVTFGVAITAFFSFWAIVFSVFKNAENNVHKVAVIWSRLVLRLCSAKVDVLGLENVLPGKPQVFMANHQSDLDILIALAHLPGQVRCIAKKEVFAIPIVGLVMKRAGYVELDRQNPGKDIKALGAAAGRIREGKSVVVFPEGTKSRRGQVKPFEEEMFCVAIESGVPIVPVSIIVSVEMMTSRSLQAVPGRIKMVIDKPVPTNNYTAENSRELMQKVRNVIIVNYDVYHETGTPDITQNRPEMNCVI